MNNSLKVFILITCILFTDHCFAQHSFKDFPVKNIRYQNGEWQCGHYDETNKRIYDCQGNMTQILMSVTQINASNCCNGIEVLHLVDVAAKNISFATGSAKLLPKSLKALDDVATVLKDSAAYNIAIDAYTDNTGSPDVNQSLSEARAEAVKDYLVNKGIDYSRLTSTGYGEDKPVADNKTAAGRSKNRRVELRVTNL